MPAVLPLLARTGAALGAVVLAAPLAWTVASGDVYLTVTGESMSPTYEVGDVLVVRRGAGDELSRTGEVVVVDAVGGATRYVHRVVEPTADGAWLQGDGNPTRDPRPVTQDRVLGTPRTAMTGWAAAAFAWTQSLPGRVALAGATVALLLVPRHRRTAPADTARADTARADTHRPGGGGVDGPDRVEVV